MMTFEQFLCESAGAGGVLLVYAKERSPDGLRKLYAMTVTGVTTAGKLRMAHVNRSGRFYRVVMEDGRIRVRQVQVGNPPGEIALHWNKTPMHGVTLEYTDVQRLINERGDAMAHIAGVDWNI